MRYRLLLLMTCSCLVAAAAEAQVFNYMAMGDSLTDGSFDEQNNGGYRGRLKTLLGCSGGASSCQIYNEGIGGNTTAQMVSRTESALNKRAYDVMLLMGGTNDIFNNISANTVEFNLTEIYNKATARGVDTVFASIIRFHPSGIHGTSKNQTVINLRNKVSTLANQRSGYYVNNWAVLCPSGACFSNDYYSCVGDPSSPPPCGATQVVDPVGHPDGSGYDIMAGEFHSELTSEALPAVPTPTSPTGTVVGSPTTFSWNRDPGNRATWYQLQIDDNGGVRHLEWYEARFDCTAGTCTVNPGVNLTQGTYSWRVRGRTPRGRGSWSAYEEFTIQTAPSKPTPVAPTGTHYVASPTQFTYEWNSVANANNYQIQVFDPAKVIDQTYATGAVCSGGSCEATPGTALGGGDYTWRVRASNGAGSSNWSSSLAFTVIDSPPAQSTPGYPDREIYNTDPKFRWTGAETSTYYLIEVFLDGGAKQFEKTFDTSSCSGFNCSGRTGMALTPDDYTWRVISGNPVGESTPSAHQPFTVLTCSPQTAEVENQVVTTTVLVQACETVTAGNLGAGPYSIDANGDVTLHGGDEVRLENGFSVLSDGELTVVVDP